MNSGMVLRLSARGAPVESVLPRRLTPMAPALHVGASHHLTGPGPSDRTPEHRLPAPGTPARQHASTPGSAVHRGPAQAPTSRRLRRDPDPGSPEPGFTRTPRSPKLRSHDSGGA